LRLSSDANWTLRVQLVEHERKVMRCAQGHNGRSTPTRAIMVVTKPHLQVERRKLGSPVESSARTVCEACGGWHSRGWCTWRQDAANASSARRICEPVASYVLPDAKPISPESLCLRLWQCTRTTTVRSQTRRQRCDVPLVVMPLVPYLGALWTTTSLMPVRPGTCASRLVVAQVWHVR
jgi:hypothetical protein